MTRARPRDEEWATGARPRECMHAGMHGAQRLERARGRGAGRSELCGRTACGSEGGARRAFEPQGVASWGTARQSYPQERKAQPRGRRPTRSTRTRESRTAEGGPEVEALFLCRDSGDARGRVAYIHVAYVHIDHRRRRGVVCGGAEPSKRASCHRADGRRESSQHSGPTGDTVVILLSM